MMPSYEHPDIHSKTGGNRGFRGYQRDRAASKASLSHLAIIVMETTQHRKRYHCSAGWQWVEIRGRSVWNALAKTLMRPGVIEVVHVGFHDSPEMTFTQDQDMIKTFAADTAQAALVWSESGLARYQSRCFQWLAVSML